jgi:hypothetical protein
MSGVKVNPVEEDIVVKEKEFLTPGIPSKDSQKTATQAPESNTGG